jgi:hypothetical protein
MNTYLITYNLNNGDDDYDKLFDRLDAVGETWHDGAKLDSVWFLKTNMVPKAIRAHLRAAFDRDDTCFIIDITGQQGSGWMPTSFWTWLSS